ncbi:AGAP001536-PA [Anopheles gambiae str. PEST]|uniref:AGAP001536-PA n=1 Tax=Anopheles gambiae TaxID=7165 RepID=A0NH29_ANOGA|nr:AGAP001536-PA [Anopheles gambiae str. PEST]
MFNTNLSLTVPSLLIMDGGTPRTPEILNSLMAMTNPLEYSFPVNNSQTSLNDSHSNSSDSPLDSPASQQHQSHQQQLHLHTGKTPSVQQTCSQLIKEGVKLLIQSKRKHSGGDSSDGNESSTPKAKVARRRDASITDHRETSEDDIDFKSSPRSTVALTPEDEDRRRRRRERNKIAATKCRMKKRERTVNLINESETLDAQNRELKSQVSKLETEYRKLVEILQAHGPTCVHQNGYQPLPSLSTIIGAGVASTSTSTSSSSSTSSSNNSNKYLNDLTYLDQDQASGQGEIKYSECLKSGVASSTGSPMDGFHNQDSLLPPGYCKLSPTEPNSFLLESPSELPGTGDQTAKSEYIPGPAVSVASSTTAPQPAPKNGRSKPGPKPRQSRAQNKTTPSATATSTTATNLPSLKSNASIINTTTTTTTTTPFGTKGNPLIAATLMTTTPSSSPSSVPSPLTGSHSLSTVNPIINSIGGLGTTDDDDFILKNELIDTHSPYTTVQSADRFLFDATLDLYNNNAHSPLTAGLNCATSHQQHQHAQQSQHNHHMQQQQQQQQQHSATLNNNNPSMVNENDKLNHLNAIKDNTSNTLLEFGASFETLKPATVDYTQHQQQAQHSNGMHHQQQQQQSQQQLDSLLVVGDPTLGHLLHHQHQQNHHQHHHHQQQQQQQHQQQQHHQHQMQHQQQHHQLQHHLQQHHLQQQQQQQHQHHLHQQQQQLVTNTLDLLGSAANDMFLLADDDPTGFTDLDSGITAYNSINGCLA